MVEEHILILKFLTIDNKSKNFPQNNSLKGTQYYAFCFSKIYWHTCD